MPLPLLLPAGNPVLAVTAVPFQLVLGDHCSPCPKAGISRQQWLISILPSSFWWLWHISWSALCPVCHHPPLQGNWDLLEKQVGAVLLCLGPCSGASTVGTVWLSQTPFEEAKSYFLFLERICSRWRGLLRRLRVIAMLLWCSWLAEGLSW